MCNALYILGVDQLIPFTTCFQQSGSELLSAEKTAQNNSRKYPAVVNLENAIGFYNPTELGNLSRPPSGVIVENLAYFRNFFNRGSHFVSMETLLKIAVGNCSRDSVVDSAVSDVRGCRKKYYSSVPDKDNN